MKHFYIFIFCTFLSFPSFGQRLNSNEISKLSFAQIDSLMYIEDAVNNFQACIEYMEIGRAKAKAEFGEQDSTFADYTATLGHYLEMIGQNAAAEQHYLQAKEIQAKVMGKKHPAYARTLNSLGSFYQHTGQYQKAEIFLIEANKIWEKALGNEHYDVASSLHNLGELYQDMGYYEKAEPIYIQANKILKKIYGDYHPSTATAIGSLAYLYMMMGRYEKAEGLLLQSKDIWAKTEGEESLGFGRILNNLAGLYMDLRHYDKVEPLYLQAKSIAVKIFGENNINTIPMLNNLARFYQSTNQFEKAEQFYLLTMNIITVNNVHEQPSSAVVLNNFAGLYRLMGQYEKAEKLYLQGLAVRSKTLGKQHPDYGLSLGSLGVFYHEIGQMQKSKGFLLQSYQINIQAFGKEHPESASLLNNISSLYFDLGSLDTALQYCFKSIDANSAEIDSSFNDWENLDKFNYYDLSEINRSMKGLLMILKEQYEENKDKAHLKKHYLFSKTAMRLNERIRNNFSSDNDKLRFLSGNAFFAKEGIQTAVILGQNLHKEESFSFAEFNKSILLADAVKGNRARVLGDFPDTLIAKEIMLQTQLTLLKKQQYEAKTPEEKAQNNKDLVALNLEMDAFIKSIKDKYPKYHALKYENITAKVSDIQALLDGETALLEYFLTDSIIYLFVVTKNKLDLHAFPISTENLKAQIRLMRNTLTSYSSILKEETKNYNQYTETAHWFYKNLLANALKDKSIKNLIIVTDGELGHLPFEVFLVEQAPQKPEYKKLHYLLKDYNISYNYSATLLVESNRNLKTETRSNGKILACAATYSQKDSALTDLRLPYFTNLRKYLQPLPAAQKEIAALAENFQGSFLWGDSTNERFFKENAQYHSIIHLAMHGILEQKNPMLSSLAFTENKDSIEDNFLQAFEVARLKLNADLVVLSACETGYGRFEQGEGVVSLARSFMYAGVPSLIVSLWQVNDHSTSVIMKLLYQNLANGMTKDAALRDAKLEYLEITDGVAAHPAFWSAFIQLGDSKAIYLKTKTNYWWRWVLGVVVVGGIVLTSRKLMRK